MELQECAPADLYSMVEKCDPRPLTGYFRMFGPLPHHVIEVNVCHNLPEYDIVEVFLAECYALCKEIKVVGSLYDNKKVVMQMLLVAGCLKLPDLVPFFLVVLPGKEC